MNRTPRNNRVRRWLRGGAIAAIAAGVALVDASGSAGAAPGTPPSVVDGVIELTLPGRAPAVVEIATRGIRYGGAALDLTVTAASVSGPATAVTTRTDVVETAQRIPGGVEQSWYFRRAPQGHGDLVLQVGIQVRTRQPATATLTDTADGVVLRQPHLLQTVYHHGTWIDAAGRTWPVTAHAAGNAVELTVPAAVLAASTFPATLDPKIVVTPIAG
jgi:hypothetical protein